MLDDVRKNRCSQAATRFPARNMTMPRCRENVCSVSNTGAMLRFMQLSCRSGARSPGCRSGKNLSHLVALAIRLQAWRRQDTQTLGSIEAARDDIHLVCRRINTRWPVTGSRPNNCPFGSFPAIPRLATRRPGQQIGGTPAMQPHVGRSAPDQRPKSPDVAAGAARVFVAADARLIRLDLIWRYFGDPVCATQSMEKARCRGLKAGHCSFGAGVNSAPAATAWGMRQKSWTG